MNTEHSKQNPSALRRAREAAGLTREELAAKIGISTFTVKGWEYGTPILEKYRSALEQFLNTDDIEYKLEPVRTCTMKRDSAFAKARAKAG